MTTTSAAEQGTQLGSQRGSRQALPIWTLPPMLIGPGRELAACALNALVQGLPDLADEPVTAGSAAGGPHPVLLVHGYGGAKTQWFALQRGLRAAGSGCVRTFEYEARGTDIPTVARRLCDQVEALRAETGAARVHLVGHSLGGVVIRYAVTALGLDAVVGAAVTIASPHGGSPGAVFGSGAVAAQLRPGSTLLHELEAAARPGQARWLAIGARFDAVVPAERARIRPAALEATNLMVPGEGHLSILWSPRVATTVADHLHASQAGAASTEVALAA